MSGYATTINSWRKVARQISRLVKSDDLNTQEQSATSPLSETTAVTIASHTETVQTLVRQVMIANVVGASTNVGTSTDRISESAPIKTMAYEELMGVRDEVLSAIDEELLKPVSDTMYIALEQARSAVWRDMTERAENKARLVEFTPPAVMPALVLAYNYYGDASREAEIIERNGIRHGGFVPAKTLKLLTE